jgi:hypothetical protein
VASSSGLADSIAIGESFGEASMDVSRWSDDALSMELAPASATAFGALHGSTHFSS